MAISNKLLVLMVVILAACTRTAGDAPVNPTPTLLAQIASPVEQLQTAYSLTNPPERQAAVLNATQAFLSAENLPAAEDEAAALYDSIVGDYTTTTTPTLIRYVGELTLISLPDGLGLHLFPPDGPPLTLSAWNVGLVGMDIGRSETELGVGYITVDSNGSTWLHFVLAGQRSDGWRVLWQSDEEPRWWYANRNATISISPNLNTIMVTGEATNTTDVFTGTGREIYRQLRITWQRFEQGYRIDPPREGYPSDEEWHWSVAQPSAYNTLVEFLERIRDGQPARDLTTSQRVTEAALNFGLDITGRIFIITNITDDTTYTFRDTQGAFIATIVRQDDTWRIDDIRPLGAPARPTEEAP